MLSSIFNKVKKLFLSKEFLIFLFVGGFSAFLNYMSGFLFNLAFEGKYFYTISIWVGYLIGSISSFILNKTITFKANDENVFSQMIKFTIIFFCSLAVSGTIANIVMITYHASHTDIVTVKQMENIARFISIGLTTFFNYPANKFFSFRKIGKNS